MYFNFNLIAIDSSIRVLFFTLFGKFPNFNSICRKNHSIQIMISMIHLFLKRFRASFSLSHRHFPCRLTILFLYGGSYYFSFARIFYQLNYSLLKITSPSPAIMTFYFLERSSECYVITKLRRMLLVLQRNIKFLFYKCSARTITSPRNDNFTQF